MVRISHNPNRQIVRKLKESVYVKGYSSSGKSMNKFNSKNKVNYDLFSFLIENNLNRYLFGVMLRLGGLELDKIYFREYLLDPKVIKKIVKESFIKNYYCKFCNHLIFREHLNEINFNADFEISCPKCSRLNIFGYHDLKDDFNINRNDLVKFLDRLTNIKVIDKKLMAICTKCTKKVEYVPKETDLICDLCECSREAKFEYSMNYDFFDNKEGYWFEWYVYNICKHIYQTVDHNIEVSYKNEDGTLSEFELDVVFLNADNELCIFECKDYYPHQQRKKLGINALANDLLNIINITNNIAFISSAKPIKEGHQTSLKNKFGDSIAFFEGVDLEEKFIAEENILEFLRSENYKAIILYQKLSDTKKLGIAKEIISEILKSDSQDNNIKIITKILDSSTEINALKSEQENFEKTLALCFNNIQINENVSNSYKYLNSVFRIWPEIVKEKMDLNNFLECGTRYLHPYAFNSNERAPFYYFVCSYFREVEIDLTSLDENIVKSFMLKFIPMLEIYYAYYSVRSSLRIFNILWDFKDKEIEDMLVYTILKVYHDPRSSYRKRLELSNFIKDKYDLFEPSNQEKLQNL